MRLIYAPKPTYSSEPNEDEVLRSAVVVDLGINEDGTIKTLRLSRSSGVRRYDRAVVRAVRSWRYNKAAG